MPKLRPNLTVLWRQTSGRDVYGQTRLGLARRIRVGVVKSVDQSKTTSLRVDTSALRGRGEESAVIAKLLFPPESEPSNGDAVYADDVWMTVESVFARRDLIGIIRHYEVDLVARLTPADTVDGV